MASCFVLVFTFTTFNTLTLSYNHWLLFNFPAAPSNGSEPVRLLSLVVLRPTYIHPSQVNNTRAGVKWCLLIHSTLFNQSLKVNHRGAADEGTQR